MDDFNITTLKDSRSEWCSQLIMIISPCIVEGFHTLFSEALQLCINNNEKAKYLVTFQNFIQRIPKWNNEIIDNETKRICEKSGCSYLADVLTSVHITQLKTLSAIRVGQKQKKIDIDIPKLDSFIHNVYINVGRKLYSNVYLYQIEISPLVIQKNKRDIEILVNEGILETIRKSIPLDKITRLFYEPDTEEQVTEEIKEQYLYDETDPEPKPEPSSTAPESQQSDNTLTNNMVEHSSSSSTLSFNDIDMVQDTNNKVSSVEAPKTLERLEEISQMRNAQRKKDEEEDDNINTIQILDDENVNVGDLGIHNLDEPLDSSMTVLPDLLDDIEVL